MLVKSDPTAGVETTDQLTTYVDSNVLSVTELSATNASKTITPLNPYPKMGVEEALTRSYPLGTFTWARAAGYGQAYSRFKFVEAMFNIPTIQDKLAAFIYFRSDVEITVRVNGNNYVGGILLATYVPFFDYEEDATDWRNNFDLRKNGQSWIISAGTSMATKFLLPWAASTTFMNIVDGEPKACIGTLFFDVLVGQEWMSTSPPSGLEVTVYAQFINPQVAGPNINAGPTLRAKFVDKRRVKAIDQSSVQEAASKAGSGVLTTIAQTVSNVEAVVGNVAKFASMFGALDKPNDLQVVQPVRQAFLTDHSKTDGLANVQVLAQPVVAYVKPQKLIPEEDPKMSWKKLLAIPGMVEIFNFASNAAAGDVLWTGMVTPSQCMQNVVPGYWEPSPMTYYAQTHKFWSGSIKFAFYFASPAAQKATVRISFLPTQTGALGVPDDQAGDVNSVVVDIVGDTLVCRKVDFVSPMLKLLVRPPGNTGSGIQDTHGKIVVQVVQAISTQVYPNTAGINCVVWMGAGEDFTLDTPIEYGADNDPGYIPVVPLQDKRRARAVDQSCVRDWFGQPFESIGETTAKPHFGVCNPDQSRGLCEFMKRYIHVERDLPSNTQFTNRPREKNEFLAAPFMGFSGSMNWRFTRSGDPPGTGLVMATAETPGDINLLTGAAAGCWANMNLEGQLSVQIPYSDPLLFVETTPGVTVNHPSIDTVQIYRLLDYTTDGSPSWHSWQSVGDDFCLYYFNCCPFLGPFAAASSMRANRKSQLTAAQSGNPKRLTTTSPPATPN